MLDQVFLLHITKLVFLFLFLVIVSVLVIYNWLYLTHTLRANKNIGLHPPIRIRHLVQASTYIALFNAALVVIFLVLGYY